MIDKNFNLSLEDKKLIKYFKKIREDFPILKRKINNHNLIYLDNAATTQKPKFVIENQIKYLKETNSNISRSIHTIGHESTELVENSREKVAKLINCKNSQIIFTNSATFSLNLCAFGLINQIKKDDEIIISSQEHHANLITWQQICKKTKAKLKIIKLKKDFTLDFVHFKQLISKKTKIIAITHISNVLGTINPVEKIGEIAKKNNIIYIIDASQSIGYKKIDVKKLHCDFLAFSSHKMCGPFGVGVLYVNQKFTKKLEPILFGGNMIKDADFKNARYKKFPYKFETGTLNIDGIIGFGYAIDYLEKIDYTKIEKYQNLLTKYFLEKIKKIDYIKIFGPVNPKKRSSIFSFSIKNIHPHDVSTIFDNNAIAIRAGTHCAMPLLKSLKQCSLSRISFYFYNTLEEIDKTIQIIENIQNDFSNLDFLFNKN